MSTQDATGTTQVQHRYNNLRLSLHLSNSTGTPNRRFWAIYVPYMYFGRRTSTLFESLLSHNKPMFTFWFTWVFLFREALTMHQLDVWPYIQHCVRLYLLIRHERGYM